KPRAAKDVAAADHEPDLNAEARDLGDLARDAGNDVGIDTVLLFAQQRLAAELQQDSSIRGLAFAHRGSLIPHAGRASVTLGRSAKISRLRSLRHDLLAEVDLLLLDALAEPVAQEPHDLRVRLLQQIADALVRILDERLAEQRDLVELLAQPPLDHLLDDLGRLTLLLGLRAEDFALFLDLVLRHLVEVGRAS